MFLSNARQLFLFVLAIVALGPGCGQSITGGNSSTAPASAEKSDFPFSTKEPDTYQGEFVVTAGGIEDKWFVARKGDRWRFDTFRNGSVSISRIKTDALYDLDGNRKIYAAEPTNDISTFDALSYGFFKGKEYRQFESLGREGNLLKFRAGDQDVSKGGTIIYVDESSGMIVKQEFTGQRSDTQFTYAVRDLRFDVADEIFAIPEGFRRVSWEEFQKDLKK